MKTKIILIILYFSSLVGYIIAQTPGFNYQAVLRDAQGEVMPNANITLFVSLTEGESGPVLYKENHALLTNELGILNTVIGTGTLESGDFSSIIGVQDLNIKLEADIPGEPDVVDIGFSNIGATPFALYGRDEDSDPDNEMQTLSLEGDSLKISGTPGVSVTPFLSPWGKDGTSLSYQDGSILVDTIMIRSTDSTNKRSADRKIWSWDASGEKVSVRDADGNFLYKSVRDADGNWVSIREGLTREELMEEIQRGAFLTNTALALSRIFEDNRTEVRIGEEDGITLSTSNGNISSSTEISTGANGESQIKVKDEQLNEVNVSSGAGLAFQKVGVKLQFAPKTESGGHTILDLKTEAEEGVQMKYEKEGVTNTFNEGSFNYGGGYNSNIDENGNMLYGTGRDGADPLTALSQWYTNQIIYAQLALFLNAGSFSLFTNAGNLINYLGYVAVDQLVNGIVDNNGALAAYMLYANAKSTMVANEFAMPMNPPSNGEQVTYAAVAGPECAAYERGTAKLINGEATIKCSNHFQEIADPNSMTVILTPLSAESLGMAIVEKSKDGFKVKELHKGIGNYNFDWEVKCKRKGMEDFSVHRAPINIEKIQLAGSGIKQMAHLRKTDQ